MQRMTFEKWPQVKNWVLGVWARRQSNAPRRLIRRLDRRSDGVRDDDASIATTPVREHVERTADERKA